MLPISVMRWLLFLSHVTLSTFGFNQCLWNCQCTQRYELSKEADCQHLGLTSISTVSSEPEGSNNSSNIPAIGRLNLSRNTLKSIEEGSFSIFLSLYYLDLSYNMIVTIHPEAFSSNPKLTNLFLDHNPLKFPDHGPFLNAPSLKFLSLRDCALNDVRPSAFDKLRNLFHLDISGNNIKYLSSNISVYLSKLMSLTMTNNPWTCGDQFQSLIRTFTANQDLTCTESQIVIPEIVIKQEKSSTTTTPFVRSSYEQTNNTTPSEVTDSLSVEKRIIGSASKVNPMRRNPVNITSDTFPTTISAENSETELGLLETSSTSDNETLFTESEIEEGPLIPHWLLATFLCSVGVILVALAAIMFWKLKKVSSVPVTRVSVSMRKSQLSLNYDMPRNRGSKTATLEEPSVDTEESNFLVRLDREKAARWRDLEISEEDILHHPNNLDYIQPASNKRDKTLSNVLIVPTEAISSDDEQEFNNNSKIVNRK